MSAEVEGVGGSLNTDGRHGADDESAELVALLVAIDAFVAATGHHSLTMVAWAAQALDELREKLAHTYRVIALQQDRLGPLYELFPDPDTDP